MTFTISAEQANASGIYSIRNTVNLKVYVGSAVKLRVRYRAHCQQLNGGVHHSALLQAFVNKYGIDTLEFGLLELCPAENLIAREQFFIDSLSAASKETGFNICKVAGSSMGRKHSPEAKAKMSADRKGKAMSEEARKNMSGRKQSPETAAKIKLARTGKAIHTPESRARLSTIASQRKLLPEHRAKIGAAQLGKKHSAESIAKTAASHVGKKRSAETKAKISAAAKLRRLSPETRAKISASLKRKTQ